MVGPVGAFGIGIAWVINLFKLIRDIGRARRSRRVRPPTCSTATKPSGYLIGPATCDSIVQQEVDGDRVVSAKRDDHVP